MRKALSVLALAILALPLAAAVPASRIKEPNAVFAYDVDGPNDRIRAVLFDRINKTIIDVLDARPEFALQGGGSIDDNDEVQFTPATNKIYISHSNINEYGGISRIDADRDYDEAIIETTFSFKDPTVIFSCDACRIGQWIVHPTKPKLYVAVEQPGERGDEFKNAKLIEVTLSPKRRTRVIGRVPSSAALRLTPDGGKIFVLRSIENPGTPYGAVVTIDLKSRTRTQKIVNFPATDAVGFPASPRSGDVSPDTFEIAFHTGTVDVRTGDVERFDFAGDLGLYGGIGWSRDASQLFFAKRKPGNGDPVPVPIVYDRGSDSEWILPIDTATLLDWSPSQTAILFRKNGDVGFYDLEQHEWTHVLEGEGHYVGGAWVTMPTKRVPKR